MQSLMDLYMTYSYSRGLEETKFFSRVDYAYYYVIVLPLILASTFITNALSLQSGLLSALTYTWAISNRNQQVNFYFITMKAGILPVVSLGFRLLLNGKEDFIQAALGMFSGYIYNCLETRTLGPLMSLFNKNKQPQVSNRVGTLNSLNKQNVEELYYDGYLLAPSWFRKLVTGNANVAYERPRNNFTNTQNSTARTTGSTTTSTTFTSNTFRGRGHRLGAS